tara:strand:+ start:1110 stop:1700 length:591 start_codon:yes stop_codon:yes gene_type:complete
MSKTGDWYIKVHGDDDEHDWGEAEADHELYLQGTIEKLIRQSYNGSWGRPSFHRAIWKASTEILNGLEVQVVVDGKDNLHISFGTAGFVSFKVDPVGMTLPIKCWIHTHPFGSAYFSGTDWNTVGKWEPLMNNAIVLGGEGHYGQWRNNRPKELDIFFNFEYDRTQIKDKHISKLDIKTVPINDMLLEKNWDRGEE